MAASTTIISDLRTLTTSTPTAPSTANAIAAAGPIQDLLAQVQLGFRLAEELKLKLTQVKAVLDNSDPMLTTVNNVLASLV